MLESTGQWTRPRPTAVEILPAEEVAAITARYDDLINRLELELDDALAEADAAEARLRKHPAAAVIDDDFEAFVLWATEAHVVEIHRGERQAVPTAERGDIGRRDPARPITFSAAEAAPRRSEPLRAEAPVAAPPAVEPRLEGSAAADLHPGAVPVPPTAITPPTTSATRANRLTGRTTVVTRGAPLPAQTPPRPTAVLVDAEPVVARSVAQQAPVPPAPAPRAATPPGPARPAAPAKQFWDGNRADRDARSRFAALPATLLLQTGAVIVVVALILLKLG